MVDAPSRPFVAPLTRSTERGALQVSRARVGGVEVSHRLFCHLSM